MARSVRIIPLEVANVPEKYQTGQEWIDAKKAVRHSSCVRCNKKGKIALVCFGTLKWIEPEKLPKDSDYLTSPEAKDQEVIFGMCRKCFDDGGVEAAMKVLAEKRGIYSPSSHQKLLQELKEEEEAKN